jgi:hypothetical protein
MGGHEAVGDQINASVAHVAPPLPQEEEVVLPLEENRLLVDAPVEYVVVLASSEFDFAMRHEARSST